MWGVFLTWEYTLVHKTLDINKEGGSRQQHLNVTFSPAKTAPSTPVGVGVLPARQRAHLSRTNSCGIGASPSGTKLCNRGLEGSTNQAYSSGFYFRVSWILMVGPCLWQNHSLAFQQVKTFHTQFWRLLRPFRNVSIWFWQKIKSFHQYSWNSEVETTWISLIGWPLKTSTM